MSTGPICLKIGGALLADGGARARFAAALARAHAERLRLVVVHGGGRQLARAARALGLAERRHEGLRLTDAATARLAVQVLCGEVNKQLVAACVQAGLPALGLCGADLGLFRPRRKEIPGVDLGYVGTLAPQDVAGQRLGRLLDEGFLPVVATMGPAPGARPDAPFLNVNADEAAGPIAAAATARRLLFLTDEDGVRGPDGSVAERLDRATIARWLEDGTITGGMVPKVRAALAALAAGVPEVRILGGGGDPIARAARGAGTEIRP